MDLRTDAGTIACCDHTPFACLPDKCQCCHLYASIKINVVDFSTENVRSSFSTIPIDRKLLHDPITKDMLSHEPYTPESADSHSPAAMEETDSEEPRKAPVSPDQLKHKLEDIIRLEFSKSPRLMTRSASQSVDIVRDRDVFFRTRAMSEVPKTAKAKLIPTTKAGSLQRLQSHHSSSDEEWFEFNDATSAKCLEYCEECSDEVVSKDETVTVSTTNLQDEVPISKMKKKLKRKCRLRIRTHRKNECCCIS